MFPNQYKDKQRSCFVSSIISVVPAVIIPLSVMATSHQSFVWHTDHSLYCSYLFQFFHWHLLMLFTYVHWHPINI